MKDLFRRAHALLLESNAEAKATGTMRLAQAWCTLDHPPGLDQALPVAAAGRPPRPEWVAPTRVPKRSLGSLEGRAALIHALTHIEFNAINLALDAACRFAGLPPGYYADWIRVAGEEAHHFQLLRNHLRTLGFDYGDFVAHGGLWDMAAKTAHDPLARMALVPRVLEARGLDVTPGLRTRLAQAGDARAAQILAVIERDEIGHVAIGNRWYAWLCAERGLDPLETFVQLIAEHHAPAPRPPFAWAARRAAGFSAAELAWLGSVGPAGL